LSYLLVVCEKQQNTIIEFAVCEPNNDSLEQRALFLLANEISGGRGCKVLIQLEELTKLDSEKSAIFNYNLVRGTHPTWSEGQVIRT
ncbi:unnamed protein product, partial [Amoebophrya sp. A25]